MYRGCVGTPGGEWLLLNDAVEIKIEEGLSCWKRYECESETVFSKDIGIASISVCAAFSCTSTASS